MFPAGFAAAAFPAGADVALLRSQPDRPTNRMVLRTTGLERYVNRIVDAFEVGYLKMRPEYWPNCQRLLSFDPSRSLFMDDDEGCLMAAKEFGVAHLVHSAKSSSQLPPSPLSQFFSIAGFTPLLNGWSSA